MKSRIGTFQVRAGLLIAHAEIGPASCWSDGQENSEMTTPNEAYKRAANSPAGRQAAETARSIGEEVSDFADDVSRKASKQFARAQDMAVDTFEDAQAAIKSNPLTALLIALGIGFLFGIVISTRR
jgi:ElaB/YqjD/DUF883 family membrane-anchored ribosome-binding protein